jgi:hypothetical protein
MRTSSHAETVGQATGDNGGVLSSNGAKAAKHTDWSPLRGRRAIIWENQYSTCQTLPDQKRTIAPRRAS